MNASHWARYTETFIPLLFFDAWEGGETSPYWRIIRSVRRATISFLKPNSLAFDLENSRTDFEATPLSAQANMRTAAALMEQFLPDKGTMTHNLHQVTEHLSEQWVRSGVPLIFR